MRLDRYSDWKDACRNLSLSCPGHCVEVYTFCWQEKQKYDFVYKMTSLMSAKQNNKKQTATKFRNENKKQIRPQMPNLPQNIFAQFSFWLCMSVSVVRQSTGGGSHLIRIC